MSAETLELVERAVDAWRLTGGLLRSDRARRRDPRRLRPVVRRDRDRHRPAAERARISEPARSRSSPTPCGCPADTGFDPGGIGKGLAADIVVDELRAEGAAGVCINLGGDVRVEGAARRGDAWTIAVEHPWCTRADRARRHRPRRGRDLHHAAAALGRRRRGPSPPDRSRAPGGRRRATHVRRPSSPDTRGWPRCSPRRCCCAARPTQFDLLAGAGAEAVAVDRARPRRRHRPGSSAYLADPLPTAVTCDRRSRRSHDHEHEPSLVHRPRRRARRWALLAAATLWGLALSTKVLGRRPRPTGCSTCTVGWAAPRSPSPACTSSRCSPTSTCTSG